MKEKRVEVEEVIKILQEKLNFEEAVKVVKALTETFRICYDEETDFWHEG